MKALFVDNHRFARDEEGAVLSELGFPASLWERYLAVFDELLVVGRECAAPSAEDRPRWSISSRPAVTFRLAPNISGPIAALRNRAEARRVIDDAVYEADAVILRGTGGGLTGLAEQAARRHGKLWAQELIGCPWDSLWHYGTLAAKLYAFPAAWRTRRLVAQAPFVMYVTERFLQERYPNRSGHVSYASNVEIDPPAVGVLQQRLRRIEAGGDRLVFGTVGSLASAGRLKGIDTAIRALAAAGPNMPEWEYRVLGPGDPTPLRRLGKRLGIDDRVHFDGVLPAGDPVLRLLDGIDLYLQPSRREGLPRALIEALSRGCPSLATRCAGIPELLGDEALVRTGDFNGLARVLSERAGDLNWQADQARMNWTRAHDYSAEVLRDRRHAFWKTFVEEVKRKKSGDTEPLATIGASSA